MSEEMLEKLNQILAAQVLTMQALIRIEKDLFGPSEGEKEQHGASLEPGHKASPSGRI